MPLNSLGAGPHESFEKEVLPRPDPSVQMLGMITPIEGPDSAKLQQNLMKKFVDGSMGKWTVDAQARLPGSLPAIEAARGAVNDLPKSVVASWKATMEKIRSLATQKISKTAQREASVGNPQQLLYFVTMKEKELDDLRAATANDPVQRNAADRIAQAFSAVLDAIGPRHASLMNPAVMATWGNPAVEARGSHLVRTGVFLLTASAAAFGFILAYFAKAEERHVKLPFMYLIAAATAAGWVNLTSTPSERLRKEVEFLTVPQGTFEKNLQIAHNVKGPLWGEFAENFYGKPGKNPLVRNYFEGKDRSKPEKVEQQRAAILALAPEGIRKELTAMLDSVNEKGEQGADFRTLIAELSNATSADSQAIVINFIRSGTTRQSLTMLNPGRIIRPSA